MSSFDARPWLSRQSTESFLHAKQRQRVRSHNRARFANRSRKLICELLESRELLAADFVPGELLVQYALGASDAARSGVRSLSSAQLVESIQTATMKATGTGVLERVKLPSGMTVDQGAAFFKQQPGVLFAEPNYRYTPSAVSDDPEYANGNLWGMYSNDLPTAIGPVGTTNNFGIQAEKAWNKGNTGSKSVVVGVIDTGIQVTHPDLVPNIWVNPFDPVDGIDNDGNGYVDDVNGWDFANNDNSVFDSAFTDDHGTHVSGTIGGKGGNTQGVAGVNWDVTIISGKFLNPSGTTADAVKAVDYFTDLKTRHGINIVATNNSWGGVGFSEALLDAIIRSAKAEILFVAAAGNAGTNNDTIASYPSNYSTLTSTSTQTGAKYDGVIAVAAIDRFGAVSVFSGGGGSNIGRNTVDIAAPGSDIISTVPTSTYAFFSGTSMATPHVTGAAALYASKYPVANALEIRTALLNSATPTSSLVGKVATGGRLNVDAALNVVPLPTINVADVTVIEGDTGTQDAIFEFNLSRPSTSDISVQYETVAGTATQGVDYVGQSGNVFFPAGTTIGIVTIPIIGDLLIEPIETFSLRLSFPRNAILGTASAKGSIISNDLASARLLDAEITEGNSGTKMLSFPVELSAAQSANAVFAFATTSKVALAGSDFLNTTGKLTIPAGATRGFINVPIIGDTIVETDETLGVTISSPESVIIERGTAEGKIINDDATTTVSIADSRIVEGNFGTTDLFFQLTLSAALNSFVTVSVATSDGTATVAGRDYDKTETRATFSPGQTRALVRVPIRGDRVIENDETFQVRIVSAINVGIGRQVATGTIVNDDLGNVTGASVAGSSAPPVSSGGTPSWQPGTTSPNEPGLPGVGTSSQSGLSAAAFNSRASIAPISVPSVGVRSSVPTNNVTAKSNKPTNAVDGKLVDQIFAELFK